MTRQKKEIIKKIQEITSWIETDIELGCGFSPPGAYDKEWQEIGRLERELASLCHYKSAGDMYFDERGQISVYKDDPSQESIMEQQL